MRVWKCETVERKVEKGPDGPFIPMDKMTKHDSMFGFNVWVKGIRFVSQFTFMDNSKALDQHVRDALSVMRMRKIYLIKPII